MSRIWVGRARSAFGSLTAIRQMALPTKVYHYDLMGGKRNGRPGGGIVGRRLDCPEGAARYLCRTIGHSPVEHLSVIYLCPDNAVLGEEIYSDQSAAQVTVVLRQIVKCALGLNAQRLVFGHNHPSGDPEPSRDDVHLTGLAWRTCRAIEITMLDHIVVAGDRWVSMLRRGMM
ncbi:JAB domain-containing protein [Sphingomonas tabacisoli]|uniref:JAB domain-containing protein n=1 Tax=Sphingomonas tabacisoli TaxID=2249466 RepID=A0ABW4HZX7_9SPHN